MDGKTYGRVEKLDLEHWFVNYQLLKIRKAHVHLPGAMDVDITALVSGFNEKPSAVFTAVLIKALGLVLEALPAANCVYMDTFFGPRLVRPNYIAINLPIYIRHPGGKVLTATVIHEPHKKTVYQIREEIRLAAESGPAKNPVARFLVTHKNRWHNRLALRVLAFVAMKVPAAYLRFRAGGLSLSSLLAEGKDAHPITTSSFGPTVFTVIINSIWQENGRWNLRLGVAFDHLAAPGTLAVVFGTRLAAILNGRDADLHARLLAGIAPTFGEMQRAQASSPDAPC